MERTVDLRGLAPPEPLERTLAMLPSLGPGDCLRVLLPHEPLPLYALLDKFHFLHEGRAIAEGTFEVAIRVGG